MPRVYEAEHAPDAAEVTVWSIADKIESLSNRQLAAVVALAALRSVEAVLATLTPAKGKQAQPLDWSGVVALIEGGQSPERVGSVASDMRQIEQRLAQLERELASLGRMQGGIPNTRPAQTAIAKLETDLRLLQAKADGLAKVEQRLTKLERRAAQQPDAPGRRVVRRPRSRTEEEVHA